MAVIRLDNSDDSQSTTLESRPESHLHRKQEHDGHRRCACDRLDPATLATGPCVGLATADASPDAHARRLGRRQDPPLARGVTLHTHPLARLKTTADQLVDFDGPDGRPLPPALHRPAHKKVGTTLLYGLAAMTGDLDLVRVPGRHRAGRARAFGVGEQVVVLGFSLFLLGFRAGPAGVGAAVQGLRAPRRRANAHIRRAVCFSTGGVLGDLFAPDHRGVAMSRYAMVVVGRRRAGAGEQAPSVAAAAALGAIPYIFGEPRGWGAVARELPFVAILLCSLTGAVLNVLNQLQYNKTYRAHGGCGP
ncbi:uncharacterized protein PG998_004311 [Apiospora kogelbergensis]|uniref:uncharacterized protein n=1 Tax=Apiospora kogelbergensis TaxID=1337665 RepID=UPI00312CFB49